MDTNYWNISEENYEKNETEEIQNEISSRGITRLCHLTHIDSLYEILFNDTGILASKFIIADKLHENDQYRMDGRRDYISTSIQFPNIWYYKCICSKQNYTDHWAVIYIDPKICRRKNTLFCSVNAATGCGKFIGAGVHNFRKCFSEKVMNQIRTENMLKNCPTSDQAEVMIFKQIPVDYIKGIAFKNKEDMQIFIENAEKNKINYPSLYLASKLFERTLSTDIRNGIEPKEILCREKNELWQKDQFL